jgi:hypothetical protein
MKNFFSLFLLALTLSLTTGAKPAVAGPEALWKQFVARYANAAKSGPESRIKSLGSMPLRGVPKSQTYIFERQGSYFKINDNYVFSIVEDVRWLRIKHNYDRTTILFQVQRTAKARISIETAERNFEIAARDAITRAPDAVRSAITLTRDHRHTYLSIHADAVTFAEVRQLIDDVVNALGARIQ